MDLFSSLLEKRPNNFAARISLSKEHLQAPHDVCGAWRCSFESEIRAAKSVGLFSKRLEKRSI